MGFQEFLPVNNEFNVADGPVKLIINSAIESPKNSGKLELTVNNEILNFTY